jgi:hypothetical protein
MRVSIAGQGNLELFTRLREVRTGLRGVPLLIPSQLPGNPGGVTEASRRPTGPHSLLAIYYMSAL